MRCNHHWDRFGLAVASACYISPRDEVGLNYINFVFHPRDEVGPQRVKFKLITFYVHVLTYIVFAIVSFFVHCCQIYFLCMVIRAKTK